MAGLIPKSSLRCRAPSDISHCSFDRLGWNVTANVLGGSQNEQLPAGHAQIAVVVSWLVPPAPLVLWPFGNSLRRELRGFPRSSPRLTRGASSPRTMPELPPASSVQIPCVYIGPEPLDAGTGPTHPDDRGPSGFRFSIRAPIRPFAGTCPTARNAADGQQGCRRCIAIVCSPLWSPAAPTPGIADPA